MRQRPVAEIVRAADHVPCVVRVHCAAVLDERILVEENSADMHFHAGLRSVKRSPRARVQLAEATRYRLP